MREGGGGREAGRETNKQAGRQTGKQAGRQGGMVWHDNVIRLVAGRRLVQGVSTTSLQIDRGVTPL